MGISTVAYADMGEPFFLNYEAVLLKQDGFSFTDYDGNTKTVANGETVTVTGEFTDGKNGETLANVKTESGYCDIPLKYLKKLSDEVSKYDAERAETPVFYKEINPEGAPVRKGPAGSYEETGKIPCGTEIEMEFYFGVPSWCYVEYNGVSGWTEVDQTTGKNDYAVLTENSPYTGEILVIGEGVKLVENVKDVWYFYDDSKEYSTVTQDIPEGTLLKYDYFFDYPSSIAVHTEYEGVEGWLAADDISGYTASQAVATGKDCTIMVAERNGAEIYTGPFNTGEPTGVVVPFGLIVSADMRSFNTFDKRDGSLFDFDDPDYNTENAGFSTTYRVTYKGTEGWITDDYNHDYAILESSREFNLYAKSDIPLKKDPDSDETVTVIPSGSVFTLIFSQFRDETVYYVEYDGKYGWIDSFADKIIYEGRSVYSTATDLDIYSEMNNQGELLGSIPSGARFVSVFFENLQPENLNRARCYAVYEGTEGWVEIDNAETVLTYIRSGDIYTEENEKEKATGEDEHSAVSPAVKNTVLYCVAAALIIAAAAGVTIVLISRKKKEKTGSGTSEE